MTHFKLKIPYLSINMTIDSAIMRSHMPEHHDKRGDLALYAAVLAMVGFPSKNHNDIMWVDKGSA